MKLRLQDSPFYIEYASSVTICSALRRKILMQNSVPTAIKARFLPQSAILIPDSCCPVFRSIAIRARNVLSFPRYDETE